jgi:anthranilate 3-monooxygenase (FAD) / 4-hydroxyphenylacetate 3-monooxygenase
MSIRTGAEYIAGLRDSRVVWYDGRRVDDVTAFPPFAPAVRAIARLYDLQHAPAQRDLMSVESAELGTRIARAFEIPRTPDDLRAKRETYLRSARATCGVMGLGPDFLNVMLAALAAKRDFFAAGGAVRAQAIADYYRHAASRDLFLTHALVDPKLDRGRLRHQRDDPGIPLRVTAKTAEGLVLNGLQRVAPSAPFADEILVWPFPPTFQPGEEAYANVFAVPMAITGLTTLCRPSVAGRGALRDHPQFGRFDRMDATVVFEDVLVPWERVFVHEDIALLNRMHRDTRMRELIAHQTNARLEVKFGFVYALAVRMAEARGVAGQPEIVEALGEAVVKVETIRSTTRAAEAQAERDPDNGVLYPYLPALQVGRALGPIYHPELCALVRRVAGGGLVQLPVSLDEIATPAGGKFERSLRGAGRSRKDEVRLLELARDLCGSEFGARHELHEMNDAGERGALVAGLQREYARKGEYLALLDDFLGAA